MIGWINLSVEAFVRDSFGDAAWEAILEKTKEDPSWVRYGIPFLRFLHFRNKKKSHNNPTSSAPCLQVSSRPYPDKITYDLVITGAGLLGVSPAEALEAYGQYFVGYVNKQVSFAERPCRGPAGLPPRV